MNDHRLYNTNIYFSNFISWELVLRLLELDLTGMAGKLYLPALLRTGRTPVVSCPGHYYI